MFKKKSILRSVRAGAAGASISVLIGATGAPLAQYKSSDVVVRTDLSPDAAREAGLRLSVLRHSLASQDWGFPKAAATPRVQIELFRTADQFIRAGGRAGAAGIFLPDATAGSPGRMLVVAGPILTLQTWHVLQHEGFHQYAFAAVHGRSLPPWLDEGLAEYVGEGLFTGDGYELGVIPPWRLARLRAEIRSGNLPPLASIVSESREQWTAYLTPARYDLVWSLVHFLLNANDGRDASLLAACVRSGGADPIEGPPGSLEERWRSYWLSQPPNPTAGRYAQAMLDTLNGFLTRATAVGQRFDSFSGFRSAAEAGHLRQNAEQWLPPSLLQESLAASDGCGTWRLIDAGSKEPVLEVGLPNGTVLRAH